jgi:hypothetical protein
VHAGASAPLGGVLLAMAHTAAVVTVLLSKGRETDIGRDRRHESHVLDPRPKVKV